MQETNYAGGSTQEEVKSKLRLMTALSTFLVMVLVGIILVFIYEPVSGLLDFLPDVTITVIVLIVLVLTGVVSYLSRKLTRQVLNIISLYSTRLDSILNVTRDIRGELYTDTLLEKIMECSMALTGSEAGSILFVQENELVFKVAQGEGISEVEGKSVQGDMSIAAWVADHGTPLYVEDFSKNEGFESSLVEVSDYKIRSALCVPLQNGDRITGVIELYNKKKGKYDDKDIELVSYLADQAAVSFERAEFYENQRNYEVHITDMLIDVIDNSIPEKLLHQRQGHSRRVAKYADVMAKAVDMSEEERRRLYFASLLHDIGFLKAKPGDSPDNIINVHPLEGYEMLNSINFYKDIAPFVLHHHERFDGTGYPHGLESTDIPLEARIIAVAEAFDMALDNGLPAGPDGYLPAFSELWKKAGYELDHSLVELFINGVEGILD